MFIKDWWDVALNSMKNCEEVIIVILRRYVPSVVVSQYNLNWFGANHMGHNGIMKGNKRWYYSLNEVTYKPHRVVEPVIANPDQLEKIIGYVVDIEGRSAQLAEEVNTGN